MCPELQSGSVQTPHTTAELVNFCSQRTCKDPVYLVPPDRISGEKEEDQSAPRILMLQGECHLKDGLLGP